MVYPELHGALVILRPLHRRYFKEYLAALSPHVRARLHLHDPQSELSYLYHALIKMYERHTFFYCIFDRRTNHLIGAVEIRDPELGRSQLYSWINEKYWGTGHFREALLCVARAYFQYTDIPVLSARVDITNRRSYHALTRCGFAQAGMVAGPRGPQYELILRRR